MYKDEKSYLELKVTFFHVLTLIISLICIGGFLFYLGYSAGKNSGLNSNINPGINEEGFSKKEILKVEDITPGKNKKKIEKKPKNSDSIQDELNNFKKSSNAKKNLVKSGFIKRERYYSIQVGSFVSHKLAKNYAAKFSSKGYQTGISQVNLNNKTWFRVRVGNYKTLSDAKKGKKMLERLEKGKFAIVKSN